MPESEGHTPQESPFVVRGRSDASPVGRAAHQFLRYKSAKPLTSDASRLVAYIINRWVKSSFSVTQFRKRRRFDLTYSQKDVQKAVHLDFEQLVAHVQETRSFRPREFDLPMLESEWLDASLAIAKPDAPIARADCSEFMKLALATPFGDTFPLAPCIDREGAAYASFQAPIQENIVTLHHRLVSTSHEAPSLSNRWRNDLRMLLNECVSAVDITLHQLYFMAQYRGAEFGWRFEPLTLGKREGARLKDKLSWIGKITGRPLDDAKDELAAFTRLKAVRNHFNHFDPPCVAYTIEDLTGWLNHVPLIGRLLWKIRDKLDAQLSTGIVEIVALPLVEFVPMNPDWPRIPQPDDAGYASTVWPTSDDPSRA